MSNCLVRTFPYPAPAGWTGPIYQPPASVILAREELAFWGDGGTAELAGGGVGAWHSRGTLEAGYLQETPANRALLVPNGDSAVIGGRPWLYFDGATASPGNTRDYLLPNDALAALDPALPYSMIGVIRPDQPGNLSFVWGNNSLGDNAVGVYLGGTNASLSYTHGRTQERLAANVTAGAWIAYAVGWNGIRHTLIVDGARQNGTPGTAPVTPIPLLIGTRSDETPNVSRFTGGMAMHMFFRGVDVTDDPVFWAHLRGYLQAYYGWADDPLAA
ncbi:MAG: hypothetical protein KF887_07165 [Paracoccaceae bacterium]|nr:MAG: hypothetical protein KF887_07165 [Paracoccaceae bacterium]